MISPSIMPGSLRVPESASISLAIRSVHTRVRGRSRFKIAQLYRSEEWKQRLESGLAGVDGILSVQANILTGSLLVVFEPQRSLDDMVLLIAQKVGTVPGPTGGAKQAGRASRCISNRLPQPKERSDLGVQVLHFTAFPAALPAVVRFFALPLVFMRAFVLGLFHTSPILMSLTLLIVLMGQIIGEKEGWSRTDALYFTFVTASTVGYGDLRPTKQSTKFLAIGIGLVGLLLTGMLTALGVHSAQEAFKVHVT